MTKEERTKAAALKLRVMSDSWPSVTESEQFLLPWETGPLRDGSGNRPAFLSEVLSLKRVSGAILAVTQLRGFQSRTTGGWRWTSIAALPGGKLNIGGSLPLLHMSRQWSRWCSPRRRCFEIR
ncbi:MAG: hypothetical protein GY826_07025 [Fuerstiella sp.]|nr:hypothetical protein [Fuerstiella sp.]